MANNRMILKHQFTKEELPIARHFGGIWQACGNVEKKLDEFFEKHSSKHGHWNDTSFVLEFESDEPLDPELA